jgi:hypothetical protein
MEREQVAVSDFGNVTGAAYDGGRLTITIDRHQAGRGEGYYDSEAMGFAAFRRAVLEAVPPETVGAVTRWLDRHVVDWRVSRRPTESPGGTMALTPGTPRRD